MFAPCWTRTAHSRTPGLPTAADNVVLESVYFQESNRCKGNSNTKKRKPIGKRNHKQLSGRSVKYFCYPAPQWPSNGGVDAAAVNYEGPSSLANDIRADSARVRIVGHRRRSEGLTRQFAIGR
jgi:hypothetical protein